jgi:Domain of unknown function (DUF305)
MNVETSSPKILLSVFFCALAVQAGQPGSVTRPGNTAGVDAGWSELNSSMQKMHAAMASVKPSGKSDVDFVRLMVPHHQAAIDMAKTELLHATDPQIRRLAQEIITDQQSEIELMQLWLKQHESRRMSQPPVFHPSSQRWYEKHPVGGVS